MSGAHTVEAGETLTSIATKYDLKVDDLVRWNRLDNPDAIDVGQRIELSGHDEAPGDQEYVIQPGDTVSSIAEKFGKRWIDIGVYNKLEDINVIIAGQKLIIPAGGVAR